MKEFKTIQEIEKSGKRLFYFNVFGWSVYYTLEPTFATPTGKLWNEGFPRVVRFDGDSKMKPTKKTEI